MLCVLDAAMQNLVYLSPDSPNVLTALDASKTYVIGGIVDKSRKKVRSIHTLLCVVTCPPHVRIH